MFTSGSHGVPNVNLLDFMFLMVGTFCDLLQTSSSKIQSFFSKQEYVLGILTVL